MRTNRQRTNHVRRGTTTLSLALATGLALATAAGGAAVPARASGHPGRPAATQSASRPRTVPVRTCATVSLFSDLPGSSRRYPTSRTTPPLPKSLPSVDYVAPVAGKDLYVLVPKGWVCETISFGTGYDLITLPSAKSKDGRGVYVDNALFGHLANVLCPSLPEVMNKLDRQPCPTAKPAKETVRQLNATTWQIEDPPGVKGIGIGSGKRYRSISWVVVHTKAKAAWHLTCTMPDSQRATCLTLLKVNSAALR